MTLPHTHRALKTVLAAALLAGLANAAACQRSRVAEPVNFSVLPKDEGGDQDYWHSLPGRSAVTNDEAFHGVLLLADGIDPTTSYEERLELLRSRGWVVEDFSEPADYAVQRGTLAKAICHALDIRGGVMMHLTNRAPRYAVRELTYLRVMSGATENQVISGLDFVGVIAKAQDYQMLREAKAAPAPDQDAPENANPDDRIAPQEGAPAATPPST
ncbi:MAG: hypothetical protein SFZ24_05420 [Planctomycetota bacterium]|nr:hypothetical protein [Planctomycetota bacterium]